MKEPASLILTALAARPLHGHGIVQSVAALSGGEVQLRPGTLYGALDRLDQQGLITVDRDDTVDGRPRRYYRLSAAGTAALATQTSTPHRTAVTAGLRPGLAGGTA